MSPGPNPPADPPFLPPGGPPSEPPANDGFSDETLMMFADGVLDDATSEAVSRALETDPALVERLEPFLMTRDGLRGAFRDVIDAPAPPHLVAAIMAPRPVRTDQPAAEPVPARPSADEGPDAATDATSTNVTPFRRRDSGASTGESAGAARRGGFVPMAMAAGIAAAVAGLGGFLAGQQQGALGNAVAAIAAAEGRGLNAIATARDGETVTLGRGLTGQATGTYRLADRSICRTVGVAHGPSTSQAEAVVCARPQGWRVELALPRGEGASSFRPASGEGPIDSLLEAGGATAALTPAEVEVLIRSQWR